MTCKNIVWQDMALVKLSGFEHTPTGSISGGEWLEKPSKVLLHDFASQTAAAAAAELGAQERRLSGCGPATDTSVTVGAYVTQIIRYVHFDKSTLGLCCRIRMLSADDIVRSCGQRNSYFSAGIQHQLAGCIRQYQLQVVSFSHQSTGTRPIPCECSRY